LPVEDTFIKRSIEIICRLQEEDGGILATQIDDAYPFVYPRDASVMTIALNTRGLHDRSMHFYDYLNRVRRINGEIYQRYNRGMPYVTRKREADVTPMVIHGIYDTYRSSGNRVFLERMWDLVAEGANFVIAGIDTGTGLVHTGCSIHENVSLEEGFEIWANSASVKGLLDASIIAGNLEHRELAEEWLSKGRKLWGRILERLYDRKSGLFWKNMRRDGTLVVAPDVAQLAPFYFRLCQDKKLLKRTLVHLRETLWNPAFGGVNRFRDFEVVKDWHWYTGGTGASWPLFTLWMARFYQKLGDSDSMEGCLRFVHGASTRQMEIAEKVAPIRGYKEWSDNETEFNERVTNGIRRSKSTVISIPGCVAWACPLGWSQAEYVLLEREDDIEEHELLMN
jgi:GH15 family glucan-1,4-alpha-glucosidase